MSTSPSPRKHCRVNLPSQHSKLATCYRRLASPTARLLPSGDSKGESKGRTYCPTTWNYSYQWTYASQYADQLREAKASALLCKECTLLVRIQLSKKSANHPNCAFAGSVGATMCGAMISLTPCIAPSIERDCDLHESAEFASAADMIQKLNDILSKPDGFPQIPVPRTDCHTFYAKSNERHKQYVICPEQDCEWLVYMSDQSTSMVEAIGIGDHPWWRQRVDDFHEWQNKSDRSVKTSKDAWTWEEGSTSKWSTTSTRGSSKRGQSVPVDPSKHPNQEEKGLPWRDIGPMETSHDFLYPDDPAVACPVAKTDQLSPDQQLVYIQWILHIVKLDHKTSRILESTVPTVT